MIPPRSEPYENPSLTKDKFELQIVPRSLRHYRGCGCLPEVERVNRRGYLLR